MGRGCLIWLMLLAAIAAVYRHFLAPLYEPPATWIVPLVASLFTMFGLGAIWGGRLAMRDARALRRAIDGAPLIDGRYAAVCGQVEPLGEPLLTPFSLHRCVCFEYDIRRPTASVASAGAMDAGLGGFRAEPYLLRHGARQMKVLGIPDLSEQPEFAAFGWESYVRAREHLANTSFKQMHGANIASLFSTLLEAWADDDGSVDSHWQRVAGAGDWLNAPEVTDWLVKSAEQAALIEQKLAEQAADSFASTADPGSAGSPASTTRKHDGDEREDDETDDDEDEYSDDDEDWDEDHLAPGVAAVSKPDLPRLVEKFLPVGAQVCMFGIYSAEHGALQPSMKRHGVMLRVLRGEPAKVLAGLRAKVLGQIVAGLVVLAMVAGALTLGTTLYRANPQTHRRQTGAVADAVRAGDAAALAELLERTRPEDFLTVNPPLLMQSDAPQIVQLLLDHGVNPNRANSSGETPLMHAAASGQTEIVRLLIAAGADLDAVDPRYGSTALMRALDAEWDETAQLLRAAGASDETVDQQNGTAIDPENSPPLAACVRYIEAIHAADPATLKTLSADGRKADFDDVDFEGWRNVRPAGNVESSGYANDSAATITITGRAPGGFNVTWVFQMVNQTGEWKVLRERWLTKGIRESTP